MWELVKIPKIDIPGDKRYIVIENVRKEVQKKPTAEGYCYLGQLCYNVGEHNEAKKAFEKSIEHNPEFLDGYRYLALLLLGMGKEAEAESESMLRKILKKFPNELMLIKTLAFVLSINGKLRQAIWELTKAIDLETNQECRRKLKKELDNLRKRLPQESFNTDWFMARKDPSRSSWVRRDKFDKPLRFTQEWWSPFEESIQQNLLPDIPCPIIIRDKVIVPTPSMRSFIGISIDSGEVVWESGIVSKRLSYASTPVCIWSSLIFVTEQTVKYISTETQPIQVKTILGDKRIEVIPYCAPLGYYDVVIFGFKEYILVYNQEAEESYFVSLDLEESQDFVRTPVAWNDRVIFLSKNGEILILPIGGKSVKKIKIHEKGIYSAPCVFEDDIYFEMVDPQSIRKICCYSLKEERFVSANLEGEVCSPDHNHLNFSPILCDDSVLLTSDVYPRLYRIKQTDGILEVIPLDIDIQTERFRVTNIPHIFSVAVDSYLLSRTQDGFFYANVRLEDKKNKGDLEIFQPESQIISQPIIYEDRVFFLCREGLQCYRIIIRSKENE